MKQIKIGVIGVGLLGNIHLMALRTIIEENYFQDQVEIKISALCDINQELLSKQGKEYHVSRLYENYKDLIQDSEVDVIYIVTPTNYHYDIFMFAAQHNKHIFCEKPLTNTLPKIE